MDVLTAGNAELRESLGKHVEPSLQETKQLQSDFNRIVEEITKTNSKMQHIESNAVTSNFLQSQLAKT